MACLVNIQAIFVWQKLEELLIRIGKAVGDLGHQFTQLTAADGHAHYITQELADR